MRPHSQHSDKFARARHIKVLHRVVAQTDSGQKHPFNRPDSYQLNEMMHSTHLECRHWHNLQDVIIAASGIHSVDAQTHTRSQGLTSLWVHAPNAFHLLVANEQREHNSTGWSVGAQSGQLIASQHCPD